MKNDIFTKAILSVIALALVVIAVGNFRDKQTVVKAAAVQGWKYIFIERSYTASNGVTKMSGWTENGQTPPADKNNVSGLSFRVQLLGSQGWELVTDTAYSRRMVTDPAKNWASNGVTSDETLIFKHPSD